MSILSTSDSLEFNCQIKPETIPNTSAALFKMGLPQNPEYDSQQDFSS